MVIKRRFYFLDVISIILDFVRLNANARFPEGYSSSIGTAPDAVNCIPSSYKTSISFVSSDTWLVCVSSSAGILLKIRCLMRWLSSM